MGQTVSSEEEIITEEELEKVKSCWEIVMKNSEENGVVIFKTFLDKYDYYSKFPKFKDLPREGIEKNKQFRKHANTIILTINNVIINIGNEEAFKQELINIGKVHGRKQITEEEFQELKQVILDILRDGFNLPEESLIAWNKIVDYAYVTIFQGLKETINKC